MSNSADALSWSIRVSRGHPMPARMLLIVGLSLRVNNDDDSFTVYPSMRQLAEDTDMSKSSVKRWIAYLANAKLLEVFSASRENGSRTSNRYRMAIHTIHIKPDGSAIEVNDTGGSNLTLGGGFRLNPGGGQIEPRGGVTGEPCTMNSESRTDSIELSMAPDGEAGGELPLGLPPVPTPDETRRDTIRFIEEQWAELAAELPAVRPIRGGLGEAREKKALQLAKDFAEAGETERDVWSIVFLSVRQSAWLCGEKEGRDGRIFKLQMTWLLEKRNFEKVVEGKYEDGRNPNLSGTDNSRRSPAGEALSIVLDRRRARRDRRGGGGSGASPRPG